MRKFLGGLLSLVALLFLSLAYVELAQAEDPECDQALAAKIVELVKSDKSDILKLQLRLTTLKLAAETMGEKNKTIEAYVRKQAEVLNSLDTDDVREKLTVLYTQNGAKKTEKEIADLGAATSATLKGGKYLTSKGKYRFKNKDLAAYVAAHLLVNGEESIYNTSDSAILWFQSEISEGVKKKVVKGSIAANYVEVSTQIAKLTGVMKGIQAKTIQEVENELTDTETAIKKEFARIAEEFKADLGESCAKLKTCTDCGGLESVRESATITAIAQITDEIQADSKVKDSRVAQAIANMKKEGITVDLLGATTNEAKTEKAKGGEKGTKTEKVVKKELTPAEVADLEERLSKLKSQAEATGEDSPEVKEQKAKEMAELQRQVEVYKVEQNKKKAQAAKQKNDNVEDTKLAKEKEWKTGESGGILGLPGQEEDLDNPFMDPAEAAHKKELRAKRLKDQEVALAEAEKQKDLQKKKKDLAVAKENLEKNKKKLANAKSELEKKKRANEQKRIKDAEAAQTKKKIHDAFASGKDSKFLEELKAKKKARDEGIPKKKKEEVIGANTQKTVETKPLEVKKPTTETKKVTEAKPAVTEAKPVVETKPVTAAPTTSEAPTTDVLRIRAYGDPSSLKHGIDPALMINDPANGGLEVGGTEEVGKFNIGDCTATVTLERLPVGYVNHLNFYNPYKKTTEKKDLTAPDSDPNSQVVAAIATQALAHKEIYATIAKHCATSSRK